MQLSGWGRYPRVEVRLLEAHDPIPDIVRRENSLIARGNGRAYGDAALNTPATLSMLSSNAILEFDTANGRLTCAAGALLADIIETILPQGWFVPVSPGTSYVTLGGMVAADVHGKNHHGAGSFCDHVDQLTVVLADGSTVTCGPSENPDLFAATRGGMGLTGIITAVTFRLIRVETGYIRQQTLRARNLAEAMAMFEAHAATTYSVAWIDALAAGDAIGRSVLFLGEHAGREDIGTAPPYPKRKPKHRIPFDFPGPTLNRYSIAAFNALYHWRNKPGTALIEYDTYFYPLDVVLEWNRIYGRSGFMEFQCVLPKPASAEGMTKILRRVAASGGASFLAVLKLFGKQDGLLSFPMEGFTLALDFRATPANFALLRELDAIVADHGGRLYLAKDACATPERLRQGYPRLEEFRAIRRRFDPEGRFSSEQSRRLGL